MNMGSAIRLRYSQHLGVTRAVLHKTVRLYPGTMPMRFATRVAAASLTRAFFDRQSAQPHNRTLETTRCWREMCAHAWADPRMQRNRLTALAGKPFQITLYRKEPWQLVYSLT